MASPADIRAGRAYVEIDGDNAKLKKKVAESESVLKGLKSKLGEDSSFGLGMKTLMGAGAIAGFTALGRALNQSTAKAVELKNSFQAGATSIWEMVDGLSRAVPVMGEFYSAGRNIRELFTGEDAVANAAAQETLNRAAQTDINTKKMVLGKNLSRDLEQQITEISLSGLSLKLARIAGSSKKDTEAVTVAFAGTKQLPRLLEQREKLTNMQAYEATMDEMGNASKLLRGIFGTVKPETPKQDIADKVKKGLFAGERATDTRDRSGSSVGGFGDEVAGARSTTALNDTTKKILDGVNVIAAALNSGGGVFV